MSVTEKTIDVVIPVYNGSKTVMPVVERLLQLPVPGSWQVHIIVVNDASTDETEATVKKLVTQRVRLQNLQSNVGRAAARNHGAEGSAASFLLFLDADCLPEQGDFFQSVIGVLEKGADLAFGPIGDNGTGFWAEYQAEVERQRAEHASQRRWLLAITSQNVLVRREAYEAVGGFNAEYTRYGFEDRDLAARLLKSNVRVVHVPAMRVLHDSGNTLINYCEKMRIAAQYSAPMFFGEHPALYRKMPFSRIDPVTSSEIVRRVIAPIVLGMRRPVVGLAERLLEIDALPFRIKLVAVKMAAAASYMDGAARR
ncbi:MAG: glycosyltransferase family A protein [Sedimenticola sp.]